MIKSDFGTIEINGREPVVVAELTTLLVALRDVLGEEKYELVLQNASNKELSKDGKEILRKGQKDAWQKLFKLF